MRLLITGGAGFIGSAVIRFLAEARPNYQITNVDKLTYASNLEALEDISTSPQYSFLNADIADRNTIESVFDRFQPDAVMHLAAETHVDRSIDAPMAFIRTNIVGTATLLSVALKFWETLPSERAARFRFHHISTDEVFGSLGMEEKFNEETRYDPSSPYSASKAGADHLVRAWHRTFGLPTVISNCSNNYGPYQFPEKLIPLMIISALDERPLPIYGIGQNVRDWLYVNDHARALLEVLERGRIGSSYNIGGNCEKTNIEVVLEICRLLNSMQPRRTRQSYADLITFVADRPGHDQRYAMDNAKIGDELSWRPEETFETGLQKTVSWYLHNQRWWRAIQQKASYQNERLGLRTHRSSQ